MKAGDRTYSRVAYALAEQDEWSPQEHAVFWLALLPELNLPGRASRADVLSRAAAALYEDGLSLREISVALNVAHGTIRVSDPSAPPRPTLERGTIRVRDPVGRLRPSLERGRQLIEHAVAGGGCEVGEALRRMTGGSAWDASNALPRAWQEPNPEPTGHFNLLIRPAQTFPGAEYAIAAEKVLRERWEARRALAVPDT